MPITVIMSMMNSSYTNFRDPFGLWDEYESGGSF